jgi:hypothetical protein
VIDCQGSTGNWARGFYFASGEGPGSVLEGLTITHGYGYEGGGIWCWGASPTIRNVLLVANVATSAGGGLYCGASRPALSGVTCIYNSAPTGGGIYLTGGSVPAISATIIAFNTSGGAVVPRTSADVPALGCSNIFGNAGGDWTGLVAGQFGVNGNFSADPVFCLDLNPKDPYSLRSDSPCIADPTTGCGQVGAGGLGCRIETPAVPAEIAIDPGVLNPRSAGKWITCYVELPDGYDPTAIDLATVLLNDQVSPERKPTGIGDYDQDGIADRMLKFLRSQVMAALPSGDSIEVRVTGEVAGEPFAGADTVRVLAQNGTSAQTRLWNGPLVSISAAGQMPNPGGSVIRLSLVERAFVEVEVFDVRGRQVRQIRIGECESGETTFAWDGKDDFDRSVEDGVYFVSAEAGGRRVVCKAVVIRR